MLVGIQGVSKGLLMKRPHLKRTKVPIDGELVSIMAALLLVAATLLLVRSTVKTPDGTGPSPDGFNTLSLLAEEELQCLQERSGGVRQKDF